MGAYKQLFVHCVWATWDRLPLITPVLAGPIYAALAAKVTELGCVPLAINGMPDHVHILIELSATMTIARLIGESKGSSSHLVNHALAPTTPFKWQGSYSAFTVSKRGVPFVRTYIKRQQQHHSKHSLRPYLELPDQWPSP
jgi:putative transposase